MKLKIDECNGCQEEKPIVNRKHGLCDACNFKRLHNGRSKEEEYRDRAQRNPKVAQRSNQAVKERKNTSFRRFSTIEELKKNGKIKKASKLKSISSKKKYKTSSGELLSQVEINRRLAEVKDRLQYEREPICAATGSSEFPLSWSHTISVARCKELGKAELIYDPSNLELEGYHERSSNPVAGHNIYEDGTWEQKKGLLNIERKLNYIKLHDPEKFRSFPDEIQKIVKDDQVN